MQLSDIQACAEGSSTNKSKLCNVVMAQVLSGVSNFSEPTDHPRTPPGHRAGGEASVAMLLKFVARRVAGLTGLRIRLAYGPAIGVDLQSQVSIPPERWQVPVSSWPVLEPTGRDHSVAKRRRAAREAAESFQEYRW